MPNYSELIVISDLHLAAERDKGLFRADRELACFLRWLREETTCTLVIAGDFIDFLVLEPGASPKSVFDLECATQRVDYVLGQHPEVFDALARIAESANHELIVLSGNHDPELMLPDVRLTIEHRLFPSRTGQSIKWLVHDEALQRCLGSAKIVIEHGDMYDPWNWVDHDKFRQSVSLYSRGLLRYGEGNRPLLPFKYAPPPGSELVVDFATPIRSKYPWIDTLKPERKAVLPLLYYFSGYEEKYKLLQKIPQLLHMGKRSASAEIMKLLNASNMVRADTQQNIDPFNEWYEEIRATSSQRGQSLHKGFLLKRLKATSDRDGFFDINEPDDSTSEVEFIIKNGTNLVIHGRYALRKILCYRPRPVYEYRYLGEIDGITECQCYGRRMGCFS